MRNGWGLEKPTHTKTPSDLELRSSPPPPPGAGEAQEGQTRNEKAPRDREASNSINVGGTDQPLMPLTLTAVYRWR